MGKETMVQCEYCGRRVPRSKAVPVYKYPNWLPPELRKLYRGAAVKVYVCISCAKHRGITFADWRRKLVAEERKIRLAKRARATKRKRRG